MKEQRKNQLIIFEFNEKILSKKVTVILGKSLEDIESKSEFQKIEPKLPLYNNLDSNKLLLFVDPIRNKIWMWCGRDIDSRMKSRARGLIPEIINECDIRINKIPNYNNLGIREKLLVKNIEYSSVYRVIDEGNEPNKFKLLIGLIKESDILRFKVNEFLTLELEDDKTFIYLKETKFRQCMRPKPLITEQVLEYDPHCKYCGSNLSEGQSICHVCKNKVD